MTGVLLLMAFLGFARAEAPPPGPLKHATLRFDSRYDRIHEVGGAHRLQNSALVGAEVETLAQVDLVVMAVTGEDYTSRWSSYRDLSGQGQIDSMALSLRQLYLERHFGPARVQAGSLAPVKGAASTSGLEDLGWIDGLRAQAEVVEGLVVEGVGGSLADLDTPDLFVRQRRLNYGELEATWEPAAGWELESAGVVIDQARVLRGEVGWSAPREWTAPLELRGEVGGNLATRGTQLVARLETDLLEWVLDHPQAVGRMRLRTHLRHVDPRYGRLGALSEDFYQYGTELMARLDGRIDRHGVVSWTVRRIEALTPGNAPRTDAGLTVRLDVARAGR